MAGTPTGEAERAASDLERTPAFRILARTGYAVAGVLHVVIGVIAISIGLHAGGGRADQTGAIRSVAHAPGGIVLVWLMVVGLLALGIWQIARSITTGGDHKQRRRSRLSAWGQAIGYLALAGIGISVAFGGGGSGGETLTARVLAVPGGVVLIVLIGLGIFGSGVWFVVKGIRRKFLDDLNPEGGWRGPVEIVGVAGHIAKGAALAVLGVLIVVAAVTADPDKAGGLDQAFSALVRVPFGEILVVIIGVGFIAYGVYCGFRARFAKL
jgi:heme/copper-type cytochrome/quinol oxidase subunit 2